MEKGNLCNHVENGKKMCISIVPIFNHLETNEMKEIVQTSKSVTFKRGESLYLAGDIATSLYIVHKGRVKIYRLSESGKEQLVRILEPGDFTGELALFSNFVHDSFAVALEKTEICLLHKEDLQQFLLKYPHISIKILQEFSSRLNHTEVQVTRIATEEVDKRLALYLTDLAQEENEVIILPMTRRELASYLGTTPETISRKLAQFEDEGVIQQIGQREIQILDVDLLINR